MTLIADTNKAELFHAEFAEAVHTGLTLVPKRIPTKFHYDARGSALFEDITRLDEYYLTRTEIGLLTRHGPEIAKRAGDGCAVVEFGSDDAFVPIPEPSTLLLLGVGLGALGIRARRRHPRT